MAFGVFVVCFDRVKREGESWCENLFDEEVVVLKGFGEEKGWVGVGVGRFFFISLFLVIYHCLLSCVCVVFFFLRSGEGGGKEVISVGDG